MGNPTPFLLLLLSISMVVCNPVYAQSSYDLLGSARADALGNGTTASTSAVGVHANPASRAHVRTATTVFYARQAFGLSALRYGAAHLTIPFEWGTPSIGASTFGFDDYREVHLSAGYARAFQLGTSRSLQFGATTRYYHTSISGYGSAATIALNVGLGVSLLRTLQLGAHATNVSGSSLVAGEPLPRTLAVGVRYEALKNLTVLLDVFKDVRFDASVRGGLEVWPVERLALRAGVNTAPVQFTGGVGIRLGQLQADIAVQQHQSLGWSPSASLSVEW